MKKLAFLLLMPTSLLFIGANVYAATDSKAPSTNIQLTCNGTTITLGQSQAEVIKACGEASYTRSSKKSTSTKLFYKEYNKTPPIESKTKLEFVNDKLVEISYERENKNFDN